MRGFFRLVQVQDKRRRLRRLPFGSKKGVIAKVNYAVPTESCDINRRPIGEPTAKKYRKVIEINITVSIEAQLRGKRQAIGHNVHLRCEFVRDTVAAVEEKLHEKGGPAFIWFGDAAYIGAAALVGEG
jgi:hypothetical protein